jgi:mRNA interferase MazF
MKDYEIWHKKKLFINNHKLRDKYFYEREIWFCHLGENIGFEEDGKGSNFFRAVIVLKKFNNNVALIIPLSTKIKDGKYYFSFKINEIENVAILSQIRMVDSKRFEYKIGILEKTIFNQLKEKLKTLLF